MSLTHYRVLIVDDQRAFQVMLKGMMNNIGFSNIEMCETGEQAAKFCEERPFQLLLVDYNLGVNKKNGRQLLEELRGKNLISTEAVFIIVTGENSRSMVLGALENQPDDYIMKPFSQRQLSARIERANQKRQALQSVLLPLSEQNYQNAIDACNHLIESGSRYSNYCKNLLAEIYCNIGKYRESEAFLTALLAERDIIWAKVALAKSHLGMERYEDALLNLDNVLEKHPLLLDAHDLKAQCLYLLNRPEQALLALQNAAEISPHSLERQQKIAKIARETGQAELAQTTYQTIYELSKRSLHHDVEHLLNYIRSTFDAAEKAEDVPRRHKYQHEAMSGLFRARQDNLYGDFDFATFEGLCQAKLEAGKGELIKAKKSYYQALNGNGNGNDVEIPLEFAGEGLITLTRIGEYEEMQRLAKRMQEADHLSFFANEVLANYQADSEQQERFAQFRQCHQDGSDYYAQGNFQDASKAFRAALSLAPTNSSAALNMIQSLLQIARTDKKPQEHLRECKEYFRLLDGVHLPVQHKERYQELKQSYNKIMQK